MLAVDQNTIYDDNAASLFTDLPVTSPKRQEIDAKLVREAMAKFLLHLVGIWSKNLSALSELSIDEAHDTETTTIQFHLGTYAMSDDEALEDEFIPRLPANAQPIKLKLSMIGKGKPQFAVNPDEYIEQ